MPGHKQKQRGVLTTGDVARYCRVSQQTVIRLIDDGHLPGFLVPGSTHRRVTAEALRGFMTANGLPTDLLDAATGHEATA